MQRRREMSAYDTSKHEWMVIALLSNIKVTHVRGGWAEKKKNNRRKRIKVFFLTSIICNVFGKKIRTRTVVELVFLRWFLT